MGKLGQVRWLKAVEGGVDLPMLGARGRVTSSMVDMGQMIAGTSDAVATYIKLRPRTLYNDGTHKPGTIAGILWLKPMGPGETVRHHREDGNYEIGWPVADRDLTAGPALKPLMQKLYGTDFDRVWKMIRGSMTGGRPFRIDVGDYAPLGQALTHFYSR